MQSMLLATSAKCCQDTVHCRRWVLMTKAASRVTSLDTQAAAISIHTSV